MIFDLIIVGVVLVGLLFYSTMAIAWTKHFGRTEYDNTYTEFLPERVGATVGLFGLLGLSYFHAVVATSFPHRSSGWGDASIAFSFGLLFLLAGVWVPTDRDWAPLMGVFWPISLVSRPMASLSCRMSKGPLAWGTMLADLPVKAERRRERLTQQVKDRDKRIAELEQEVLNAA